MFRILSLFFIVLFTRVSYSQCVNSFPHTEDFNGTNGGWVAGGTSSTWAWGSPSKPVISSAAGGSGKCWVIGGLTNSSYANNEASYITSPCFDFTNLQHPEVGFDVFWESERKYDGAKLQYSLDGTNWVAVGDMNSNNDPCIAQNWYNYATINYLSSSPGWSGNKQSTSGSCQGGGGSNGWVRARHIINTLAGKPSVRFRFRFGAGSQCNAYDGFAIDNFTVAEGYPYSAEYDYTCQGNNTVDFESLTQCGTGYTWNFDDPASGAANNSTASAPSHQFSAPGTYSVSLTVDFANGSSNTVVKDVVVLGVTTSVTQPVLCNGGTATVQAVVQPAGSYTYQWNNNPALNTASVSLGAGTHSLSVSGANTCSISSTIVVTEPPAITITPQVIAAGCTNDGAINLQVSGGLGPYSFSWTNGSTQQNLTGLSAGTYTVTVTDANNCTKNLPVVVASSSSNINLSWVVSPAKCTSANGAIDLSVSGNSGSVSFLWSNGQTTEDISNLAPGTYTVTATHNGCNTAETIVVNSIEVPIYVTVANIVHATCGASNGSIELTVAGEQGSLPFSYLWSSGATTQTATGLAAGTYDVEVRNTYGCIKTLQGIVVQNLPGNLQVTPTVTNAQCGNNGSIKLNVSGMAGTPEYVWSTGATTSSLQNVGAGTYSVLVKIGSCEKELLGIVVQDIGLNLAANAVIKPETCGNGAGSITLQLNNPDSFTYLWNTGATTSSISGLSAGIYSVQVSMNSCTDSLVNMVITNQMLTPFVYLGRDTGICPGEVLKLTPGAGFDEYTWQDGSTQSFFNVTQTGNYFVQVKDSSGCTGSDSIYVLVDCSDVYFPNAFTPGNDGLNNSFGPLGNISALRKYRLTIYNRYGEKVFESTDPYRKWNGAQRGYLQNSQVYVWQSSYELNGQAHYKKGTLLLIR